MLELGCARVSSDEQDPHPKRDALAALGVAPERIYVAPRRDRHYPTPAGQQRRRGADCPAVIAPSARVGPVLIDAGEVRLPKISAFPSEQVWTRRDTPS